MVSEQYVLDRHVTEIAIVSCSDRHASLGNWSAGVTSVEPTTCRAASRDANHYSTEKNPPRAACLDAVHRRGRSWYLFPYTCSFQPDNS